MRKRLLGLVVVLPLVVAGCGDSHGDRVSAPGSSTASSHACPDAAARAVEVARADLDADGTPESLRAVARTETCAPFVVAQVGRAERATALEEDTPIDPRGSFAIAIPGRPGQVAVLLQQHPRGGFQVLLVGWAADELSTLRAGDAPLFPFVATDVQSTPLSASCTADGIEITQGRPHAPVGVMPAWDIERTTYTVDGNMVTPGGTTEVADNVLDGQLRGRYPALVRHDLFTNCRVDQ